MRKSHIRRHIRLLFLLCLLLTGCAAGQNHGIILYNEQEAAAEKQTELTFFGFKADSINLIAIESAIHGFTEENPHINIIYEGLKGNSYWEAFKKRAETGFMNDIVMIDHDRMQALSAQGKLADLRDIPGLDQYTPQAASQFTEADGSIYFLPTCISTYGLYINYDLLEANGFDVPENYGEFSRICDYFVSQGIVPIIANNYSSVQTLVVAKGMYPVYQADDTSAEMQKFNQNPSALAQILKPGFEMVADMLARGWMDPQEVLSTAQTSDDLALFAQGTRPFMVTGGWASPRVAALEPGFQYGIYPYPILDDGSVLPMSVDTCIAVRADSPCLDEALSFVSYIIRPDVMWEYCDSQSSYIPLVSDHVPSDETIAPCAPYLTNGQSVLRAEYRLKIPLETYTRECATQLLSGASLEEVQTLLLELLNS